MSFKQYYKYYLSLHQNKWCRRLHVLGQVTTLCFLVVVLKLKIWSLLILAPFIIYPFAWTGHFVFEKNKPAAFSKPFWAKMCDWIMLKDWFLGRIKR